MPRVVCVVGMHRSGTSCLAGTLEEAGLHLGNVITVAPHNVKGNRENKRIMDLQEAVLVHSGGAWDRPPDELTYTDAHRRERDSIVAEYGGAAEWGFKDPRTLLTLPFWEEVLGGALTFVGTFRHPELVAASLLTRNGGERQRWLDLWAAYNERLLALHARRPFPIVRFDVSPEDYRASLRDVIGGLGLDASRELRFFEDELRHQRSAEGPAKEAPLPERVQVALRALCDRSRRGEGLRTEAGK